MDQPESVGTVATLVQFICDDWDAESLDFARQLPAINSGYREFQRRASLRDLPFMRNNAVVSLVANATALGPDGTYVGDDPQPIPDAVLPDDFAVPLRLWEKQANQNDYFVNHPMEERTDLSDLMPGPYLGYWQFEAGRINFVGSTGPVLLKMSYQRFLPLLDDEEMPLPIPFSSDCIAYMTAYAVGLARGVSQEFRTECSNKGNELLDELTGIYVKRGQIEHRRRPANYAGRRF